MVSKPTPDEWLLLSISRSREQPLRQTHRVVAVEVRQHVEVSLGARLFSGREAVHEESGARLQRDGGAVGHVVIS